jgi:esterase
MIPHHSFVGAEDAPHLGVIMHGVLGAGHNLRSFAKRLTELRPDYRFALIDLRYHGKSLGAPPPHRLDSCVDDLFDWAQRNQTAPRVVIGHSLGGKVALRYAHRHEPSGGASRFPHDFSSALRQVWTLDSDPGAQKPDENHEVQNVMAALRAAPGPFSTRADAVASLVAQGRSTGLANWLATSLDKGAQGFTWRLELEPISELLDDYFALDEWPWLENLGEAGKIRYELLVAENSDRWSGSMKERAAALTDSPRIFVHSLPDSGHWVHVDNPEGLLQIVSEHLV